MATARYLRALVKDIGKSQAEVAMMLGVSQRTFRRWLSLNPKIRVEPKRMAVVILEMYAERTRELKKRQGRK